MAATNYLARQLARLFPRRVPYLQQLSTVECGAACLAMILSYFGRPTTVSEARDACVVGRDGLRASTIAQTARRFGLSVRAFSTDLASLARLPLPAIIHWELHHFVVLERWDKRGAVIVDPAEGRRVVPVNDFAERFSGVILTFEVSANFDRQSGRRLHRAWPIRMLKLSAQTPRTLLIAVFTVLSRVLSFTVPLLLWLIFDGAIRYRSQNLLLVAAGISILLSWLRVLVREIISGLLRAGGHRRQFEGQTRFVDHLFQLPLQFFQQRSSGDLLMRAQSSQQLAVTAGGHFFSDCVDGLCCAVSIALLALVAPTLAVAVTAFAIADGLSVALRTERRESLGQENLRRTSQQQGYLLEALRSAATLKASAREDSALQRWKSLLAVQLNINLRAATSTAKARFLAEIVAESAPVAILGLAAEGGVSGRFTAGVAAGTAVGSLIVLRRIRELTGTFRKAREVKVHWERVQDVLESPKEDSGQGMAQAPRLDGAIELKNLSFRFTPDSPWVVRGVTCVIQAGQKIAIVGASGSGKSTLAMLMIGIYRPTEGEVRFDGLDLRDIDLRSLRKQFGIVLQDQFLFAGSIRQNIAFGSPGLTLEEVARAAHFAGIHEEINRMPMGYETVLYESGANLSGGQRQRLLIARAIASKPRVLMMDEATSHLDTVSEAHVDACLSQLSCTRIVIAHRLSTVRNADKILVLSNGILIEEGNHRTLHEMGGEYSQLCLSMS